MPSHKKKFLSFQFCKKASNINLIRLHYKKVSLCQSDKFQILLQVNLPFFFLFFFLVFFVSLFFTLFFFLLSFFRDKKKRHLYICFSQPKEFILEVFYCFYNFFFSNFLFCFPTFFVSCFSNKKFSFSPCFFIPEFLYKMIQHGRQFSISIEDESFHKKLIVWSSAFGHTKQL